MTSRGKKVSGLHCRMQSYGRVRLGVLVEEHEEQPHPFTDSFYLFSVKSYLDVILLSFDTCDEPEMLTFVFCFCVVFSWKNGIAM